ncbi:unnamed protein product [Boreogadus saida]
MLSSRVPMVFEIMSVLFLLLVFNLKGVYSVKPTPVKQKENSLEGTSVTLSYTLSKNAAGSDYFFWYRQYPGEPPQFLLTISGFGNYMTAESLGSDKRFSTELTEEKTGVDLKISSAAVTDSALQPTVTGNTDSLYKNLLTTKHSSISSL